MQCGALPVLLGNGGRQFSQTSKFENILNSKKLLVGVLPNSNNTFAPTQNDLNIGLGKGSEKENLGTYSRIFLHQENSATCKDEFYSPKNVASHSSIRCLDKNPTPMQAFLLIKTSTLHVASPRPLKNEQPLQL